MLLLDHTCPTPQENLALDEALLDVAELGRLNDDVLRLWESPAPLVVVGRSSKIAEEVDVPACQRLGIPVLRRTSGGAAIVAGPGCLMYALVLSHLRHPQLRMIDAAHRFVLGKVAAALGPLVPGISCGGTSDLVWRDRKVSGNSMRVKRDHLLYHGTLLYDFPLELIASCLRPPPRQPDYRAGRAHGDFVANLPLQAGKMRRALADVWQADAVYVRWPRELVEQLTADRYSRREWHEQR
jgi:lipoate-protein ligase A